MPNKGYFIQQMTRRDAGTLFDEGRNKNRAAIFNVNRFFRIVKSRLLSKAGGSEKQLFFIYMRIAAHETPSETPRGKPSSPQFLALAQDALPHPELLGAS